MDVRRKNLDAMERVLGPRFRRVPEYMEGVPAEVRATLEPEEAGVVLGFGLVWAAEEEEEAEVEAAEEFEGPRSPSGIGTRFA